MGRDQPGDQRFVAGFADDQRNARRDRPFEAGGQIVEHDHRLAGIREGMHHVAADIAGAAGYQDGHQGHPCG